MDDLGVPPFYETTKWRAAEADPLFAVNCHFSGERSSKPSRTCPYLIPKNYRNNKVGLGGQNVKIG